MKLRSLELAGMPRLCAAWAVVLVAAGCGRTGLSETPGYGQVCCSEERDAGEPDPIGDADLDGEADRGADAEVEGGLDVNPVSRNRHAAQGPDSPAGWTRTFGGLEPEWPGELALSPQGSVLAVGTFLGTVDLDPGPDEQVLEAGPDGRVPEKGGVRVNEVTRA